MFFFSFCLFFSPATQASLASCLFVSKCLIVREKRNLRADVCLTSLFSLRCSFLPIMFVGWIKSKDASCCYYVRCRLPLPSWHHPSVWNFPVLQLTFPFPAPGDAHRMSWTAVQALRHAFSLLRRLRPRRRLRRNHLLLERAWLCWVAPAASLPIGGW